MAEVYAQAAGVERGRIIEARSGGVLGIIDKPADPLAVKVMGEINIDLEGHRSSGVTDEMMDWARYVLVMGCTTPSSYASDSLPTKTRSWCSRIWRHERSQGPHRWLALEVSAVPCGRHPLRRQLRIPCQTDPSVADELRLLEGPNAVEISAVTHTGREAVGSSILRPKLNLA